MYVLNSDNKLTCFHTATSSSPLKNKHGITFVHFASVCKCKGNVCVCVRARGVCITSSRQSCDLLLVTIRQPPDVTPSPTLSLRSVLECDLLNAVSALSAAPGPSSVCCLPSVALTQLLSSDPLPAPVWHADRDERQKPPLPPCQHRSTHVKSCLRQTISDFSQDTRCSRVFDLVWRCGSAHSFQTAPKWTIYDKNTVKRLWNNSLGFFIIIFIKL